MKINFTNILIGALVIGAFLYLLNPRIFTSEGFAGGFAGGNGPANNTDTSALKPDQSDMTSAYVLGGIAGVLVFVFVIWFFFYRNK